MGQLSLPTEGLICIDSPAIIYSVEHIEPYSSLLEPLWRQVETGQCSVVCSELVVLETLVKPIRENNSALITLFRAVLDTSDVRLVPVTRPVWEEAARIRALTGLKTLDALYVATSLITGCDFLVTNDSDYRRVADLSTVVLDNLLNV